MEKLRSGKLWIAWTVSAFVSLSKDIKSQHSTFRGKSLVFRNQSELKV